MSRKPSSNAAMLHINLPEELKKEIREIAEKERRSMNSFVVLALEQYIEVYHKKGK